MRGESIELGVDASLFWKLHFLLALTNLGVHFGNCIFRLLRLTERYVELFFPGTYHVMSPTMKALGRQNGGALGRWLAIVTVWHTQFGQFESASSRDFMLAWCW